MTEESFRLEMLSAFRAHKRCCPALRGQDAVKFVFQGMLGVGHLLSSRERTAGYIASEMNGLQPDSREPLFESLSPDWCRLNLRRALADHLPPDVIAGMMAASRPAFSFTRNDVAETCRRWIASGEISDPDGPGVDSILNENFLPSHSPEYRAGYHPAYRVVSADWIRCIVAVREICRKQSAGRLLVTVDGPCASGKTTLASRLAEVFQASVAHTDDYVVPHARKTPERLSVPGGNCDVERLVREIVIPWKQGKPVLYRRYDCAADSLLPPQALPCGGILVLEGSYCNLPPVREHADVRVFLDVPWKTRKERLEKRESPDSLNNFRDRWIPLENAYFSAFRLPDADCVVCS